MYLSIDRYDQQMGDGAETVRSNRSLGEPIGSRQTQRGRSGNCRCATDFSM